MHIPKLSVIAIYKTTHKKFLSFPLWIVDVTRLFLERSAEPPYSPVPQEVECVTAVSSHVDGWETAVSSRRKELIGLQWVALCLNMSRSQYSAVVMRSLDVIGCNPRPTPGLQMTMDQVVAFYVITSPEGSQGGPSIKRGEYSSWSRYVRDVSQKGVMSRRRDETSSQLTKVVGIKGHSE